MDPPDTTFKIPSIPLIEPAKPLLEIADTPSPKPVDTKPAPPPQPPCPYIEPKWSTLPPSDTPFAFEVLRSGVIVQTYENLQTKKFWTFGRLDSCDIVMEHPSISRYHAVLQYRPAPPQSEGAEEPPTGANDVTGWYIYDLGSTHGTFVNKRKIHAKTYTRIHVGHMIKLGGSSRNFILQGPANDADAESEMTITELKEQKRRHDQELQEKLQKEQLEREEREKRKEQEGIDWGMSAEDADEETDLSHNPYAQTQNEELFLDDPKKTLRGFFEREGLELEYRCEEMAAGTFMCKVELPIDNAFGRPLVAEVNHKGKKKEAVVQCALEACRILDRHGVLRQANHEPMRKRKVDTSSDEDDFLDRTGDVEKKRKKREEKADQKALTYDELRANEAEINDKLADINKSIQKYHETIQQRKDQQSGQETADDIDEFLKTMSTEKVVDKAEIRKLRVYEQRLLSERSKVQRLIRIAKPIELPASVQTSLDGKPKVLPLFGKRGNLKQRYKLETPKVFDKPEATKTSSDEVADEGKPERLSEEIQKEEDEPKEKPILGPTFVPDLVEKYVKPTEPETPELSVEEKPSEPVSESSQSKKRRTRIRIRDKNRENVDFDDTEELDDDKYSKWVPPQNQKGDGRTELNDKFGY